MEVDDISESDGSLSTESLFCKYITNIPANSLEDETKISRDIYEFSENCLELEAMAPVTTSEKRYLDIQAAGACDTVNENVANYVSEYSIVAEKNIQNDDGSNLDMENHDTDGIIEILRPNNEREHYLTDNNFDVHEESSTQVEAAKACDNVNENEANSVSEYSIMAEKNIQNVDGSILDMENHDTDGNIEILRPNNEREHYLKNNNFDVYEHSSTQVKTKTPKHNTPEKPGVYSSPFLIKNKYKKTVCKFCDEDINSKHFARHLERVHCSEKEVKELLGLEKGTVARKHLLALLRNEGNLEPALRGTINPKKRPKIIQSQNPMTEVSEKEYAICIHCKAYFRRLYLCRRVKKCFANNEGNKTKKYSRLLSESAVYTASIKKYGNLLNKMSVKTQIFSKMQADDITNVAMNDILIIHFGEDLLKKYKNDRSLYHVSNKLRECARFLLEIKKHGEYTDLLSTLKPENFDDAVDAIKTLSRYEPESKTFGAASLALHFGTTLKKVSDLATKLLLRKKIIIKISTDLEKTLLDIKRFKSLVDTQWTTEVGSLAVKILNAKAAVKPQLLPLTESVMVLRNFVEKESREAFVKIKANKDREAFKILAETTLVLTILHNRKRVGDIQYLDLNSYEKQKENELDLNTQSEINMVLSEIEKLLTQHYKRIISIGKGSRCVAIMIPKTLQQYFQIIYELRKNNPEWFLPQNTYFFTLPYSNRWIDGCAAIRKYAKLSGAKNPELLTSSRLRKHIATVTQVLNLRRNEIDQLAKFMGHTTKTHEQFYKLPQDVYQVAKVTKILQLMEKGDTDKFKNCNLDEIDINMTDIPEDNFDDEPIPIDKSMPTTSSDTAAQSIMQDNGKGYTSDNSDSTFVVSDSDPELDEVDTISKCKIKAAKKNPDGKNKKERWSENQKKLMVKYFKDSIESYKPPKKRDCEIFIKKYKLFQGVTWLRVKTFVYNTYRLQKTK